MSDCFHLTLSSEHCSQSPAVDSFVGGKPKLPPKQQIPACKLCGSEETFFFQVAFPINHPWAGLSLAVFACTACAHENYLIPEMLPGPLRGKEIPDGFLDSYQLNFRFLTFETGLGVLHGTYRERVKFKRIETSRGYNADTRDTKIAGNPTWLLEDESPESYAGRTLMCFLLQIAQGFEFETVEGAPPQVELDLHGSPQPSPLHYYQLFIGNAVFLFGTEDLDRPLVYAITQV